MAKEYIEREAAKRAIQRALNDGTGYGEALSALPAADVEEVVRCKDCKSYYAYPDEYRTCHEHYEIDGATKMMATEDFCSKGERWEVQDG